jgi:signal transduction histidine kinase
VQWNVQLPKEDEESARLPPEAEWMLFRAAQEAMTNCAKHAQAKCLRVELKQDEKSLELSLHDDGVGFVPEDLSSAGPGIGMGLLTMRERVERVGGVLAIYSEPGSGTRIQVTLPLEA